MGVGSAPARKPDDNEETILQVHGVGPWAINYVNPADDPRKKTN